MAYDLLIRGAAVVGETRVRDLSIGIEEGRISAMAPELTGPARETIDARGLHLFPGVIDAHVHFNDPGRDAWEGAATGSAALAAGGGTVFIDMPLNSSPPTLDAASFAAKLAACRATARTDFALWGGLTPLNLDRLEELADCGVVGFKAFMANSGISDFPACDDAALYRGMRIAARLGLPVAVHAENDAMVGLLAAEARAAGRTDAADYLATRPVAAEAEAIARAIAFAGETGCRLHVVHTSSARGVRLIRAAASAGACDVTCETCPHYLVFSDADVLRIGARAKCAPPLRPESERAMLAALVAEGQVDTIGSDHSPSPPDMKQSPDFFQAWGGISGVQATLRALLTLPVELPLLARMLSGNVARRFRLPGKGGMAVGGDADCTLVDLEGSPIVEGGELLDRHRLSPYIGRPLRGQVRRTLVRGITVFRDGAVAGAPVGRFLRPGDRR
jgi:allantoinase